MQFSKVKFLSLSCSLMMKMNSKEPSDEELGTMNCNFFISVFLIKNYYIIELTSGEFYTKGIFIVCTTLLRTD